MAVSIADVIVVWIISHEYGVPTPSWYLYNSSFTSFEYSFIITLDMSFLYIHGMLIGLYAPGLSRFGIAIILHLNIDSGYQPLMMNALMILSNKLTIIGLCLHIIYRSSALHPYISSADLRFSEYIRNFISFTDSSILTSLFISEDTSGNSSDCVLSCNISNFIYASSAS